MKQIFCVFLSVVCILSVCNYAHTEPLQEMSSLCYWISVTDDTGENAIMKTSGKGDSVIHQKIGNGYMLESCGNTNIYYATSTDAGEWIVWEMFSNTPIATISDPSIIRILAYYDQTIYYAVQKNGTPIIKGKNDNSTQTYPLGFNNSEFEYSLIDELWGIELDYQNRIVMKYSSTISENGIIAYSVTEGSAWGEEPYSSSIYYSTLDQSDIYVDEGSHPAWFDRNTLLYLGADSRLYRYDVNNRISSPYITTGGSDITLSLIDSEERMFVIDGEYIAYFRYKEKGSVLSLISLITGKIYNFDGIYSAELMDPILRVDLCE